MTILKAKVNYCGRRVTVACDGNCKKAWGSNHRRKDMLSEDEDDFEYWADGELGDAPENPGTYEGGKGKPLSSDEFPNKWCVRECERCRMSGPLGSLELHDWSHRLSNKGWMDTPVIKVETGTKKKLKRTKPRKDDGEDIDTQGFLVSFRGGCGLTIDEVWPDGGAPENPTAQDVIKVMQSSSFNKRALLADWALDDDLTIHVETDSGDSEAEW